MDTSDPAISTAGKEASIPEYGPARADKSASNPVKVGLQTCIRELVLLVHKHQLSLQYGPY